MDAEARRALDLLRKVRALHQQGSVDDALALFRHVRPTLAACRTHNPWQADPEAATQGVELLLWLDRDPGPDSPPDPP
jgi:hypothetical protein